MAYKPKFVISRYELGALRYGAFAGWLILGVIFFFVFKPYNGSLQFLIVLPVIHETTSEPRQSYSESKEAKQFCDFSDQRTDVCDLSGDIRIHGKSSTIFVASSDQRQVLEHMKPYARKDEPTVMRCVKSITIRSTNMSGGVPECNRIYNVPAILFSTAGYLQNHFHDFTDLVVPLYSTSMEFNKEVQFLVTDNRSSWATKFEELLPKLSRYELIDLDYEREVLCFPRVLVGLKAYKEFSIDSTRSPYSMREFTMFLRDIYSLKRAVTTDFIKNHDKQSTRSPPRLLIIARGKNRKLSNVVEIANMARSIGFEVVVNETVGNVNDLAKFIDSFDALMGVHGAGLSNMVFLPENAVVIQIIPWGITDYVVNSTFKEPAKDMNLRSLEYKISPNESSLIEGYPYDHHIFKDPLSLYKKGWSFSKTRVFFNSQNVKLDLHCFEGILIEAYDLLCGWAFCFGNCCRRTLFEICSNYWK